jgi:TolB protein
MKLKLIVIPLTLCILLSMLLLPQEEVVMSIREGVPIIPIALPSFIVKGSSPQAGTAAETIHQVISSNLKYSRVFNPLPKSYYSYIRPLNPDNIYFKDWESIQANLLLVGEILNSDD